MVQSEDFGEVFSDSYPVGNYMQPLIQAISNFLLFLYQTTGNMGLAIILFTLIVRAALVPLTHSSLKTQKKLQDLKPDLDKLKQKHGSDAKGLQQAQMELYKK